jgi:hypothetical protein
MPKSQEGRVICASKPNFESALIFSRELLTPTTMNTNAVHSYFSRLIQGARSEDVNQLESLFQFILPDEILATIQPFISAVRSVNLLLLTNQKPLEQIIQIADTAQDKVRNFKNTRGEPLDTQWTTLGASYLQFLRGYTPNDGNIQLENFSKFFVYVFGVVNSGLMS